MPGRHITDSQRGLFMRTRETDSTEVAAAKAGFSRGSGYRIAGDPTPPPERRQQRGRRRPDPLAEVFETEVVPLLQQTPGCARWRCLGSCGGGVRNSVPGFGAPWSARSGAGAPRMARRRK